MRVSAKPLGEYPWYLRPFFWNQKRKYGQVLLPGLLWARAPPLFVAIALLYGAFERRRARVDPVLRALDVPAQGFCSRPPTNPQEPAPKVEPGSP
jgi:hypothetical protein